MTSYNSNDDSSTQQDQQQQQEKNHLGYNDNDVAAKIEQVKANRAAKGKPVNADPSLSKDNTTTTTTKPRPIESVLGDETKNRMAAQSYKGPSIESSQAQIVQLSTATASASEEPELADPAEQYAKEKPLPKVDDIVEGESNKNIKYWQNKIRENSASIQAPRTIEIQKRASKDKHIIYKFLDSKTPPRIGHKPDRKERLIPIEVYYNEIENWRHLDWQRQRAEIAHLTKIQNDSNPQIDNNGETIPAKIIKNNESETGITDEQFAKIDTILHDNQTTLYKEIALWMFGIDGELYDHLDRTSLYAALEAGQIREIFGLVESSKNSTDYLT